jgi:hypothetical protein
MAKFNYSKQQWQAVKALLGSTHIGIDAEKTTVKWFRIQRPLRDVLEDATDRHLRLPRRKTPRQRADKQRKSLAEIQALLEKLARGMRYAEFGMLGAHNEAEEAEAALTALAERLKNQIAALDAQGRSSKHNARKLSRNHIWSKLIDVWKAATVGAKRPPQRRHLIKFLRLCSPDQLAPSSDKTVATFLDRLKRAGRN